MKAIEITQPGGPEVLVACERPEPVPRPGEVLIRVAAAGINRPDVLQRLGRYPVPKDASDLPGLEVAGTIVSGDVGDSGFAIGDRVCALVHGGGYAESCVAPIGQCLPIPGSLTDIEAASLPETFFTVWSNVFQRARLAPGETFLVQGGTSGIGVTAIQIAHARGHRVFATAGTDDKARACEQFGAELGINYKTQDFSKVVLERTGNVGVNVVLDMVGGDYVPRELACMAEEGRLVLIAVLGGAQSTVALPMIMQKRLTITGSTLRPRPVAFKSAIARDLRKTVWPLIAAGKIRPAIYRTFPLEQAADGHRLLESGEHIGKIVLTVR